MSVLVLCIGALVPCCAASVNAGEIVSCGPNQFSDLACSQQKPGAPVSPKARLNGYSAAPPAQGSSHRSARVNPAASRRGKSAKAKAQACANADAKLSELRAARRAGYSSRQERALDKREAKLRAQRRDCRGPRVRRSSG